MGRHENNFRPRTTEPGQPELRTRESIITQYTCPVEYGNPANPEENYSLGAYDIVVKAKSFDFMFASTATAKQFEQLVTLACNDEWIQQPQFEAVKNIFRELNLASGSYARVSGEAYTGKPAKRVVVCPNSPDGAAFGRVTELLLAVRLLPVDQFKAPADIKLKDNPLAWLTAS